MKFYIDSYGDEIIVTDRYSLCNEPFGISIKEKDKPWKNPFVYDVDREDIIHFLPYTEFKKIISSYNDNELNSAIDKFLKLRSFL